MVSRSDLNKWAILGDMEEKYLRIVLVGKAGAGKSASGNTILRKQAFESEMSSVGVTTHCKKERGVFEGTPLAVVDTPGLFDKKMPLDDVRREIARSITFAAPGPHVFLVVIQPNRFTIEELQTVRLLQITFGAESANHMMVLFTHGDELARKKVSIESFFSKDPDLCQFIHQCGGRYHTFNNDDPNPSQVRELLRKIFQMVQRNGGRHYTNRAYEEALRAVVQRRSEIMRTNPNMSPAQAQTIAESDNNFVLGVVAGAAGVAGTIGLAALLFCNIEIAAIGAIVLSSSEVAAGVGAAVAQLGAVAAEVGAAAVQAGAAVVQAGTAVASGTAAGAAAFKIAISKAPCVIQ